MKSFFTIIALGLFGSGPLLAQEAWLVEMPKKYADYILKKSAAGELETVHKVVEKLPNLIKKNTIKSIERIKWEGPGKNYQKDSRYSSTNAAKKTHRSFKIKKTDKEIQYSIHSYGKLGEFWVPTFVFEKEGKFLILLERDESADGESVPAKNSRGLSYKTNETGTMTWYSSEPLDNEQLKFRATQQITVEARPAPVKLGINAFCRLTTTREGLVRLEVSRKADETTVSHHHNQIAIKDLNNLTGPLKKEVISLNAADIKEEGEDGSWTVTITGK